MSEKINRLPLPKFLLLWFTAGACELPFLEAMISPVPIFLNEQTPLTLALHLTAIVLMFFSVPKGVGWFRGERLWARTFMFWLLYLPFVGWILSGCILLCHRFLNKEYVFEEDEIDPVLLYTSLRGIPKYTGDPSKRLLQETDIVPLVDIFKGSDLNLKRGAIERLTELKTPEAIRVLTEHKQDSSPEVRFFINTALTRVKKEFDEELKSAQRKMKENYYKVSARFFLAKEYLAYAKSQLLDPKTSDYYLQEAQHHLQAVIKSEYASDEAYMLMIQHLMDTNQWDLALETLNQLEKRNKTIPQHRLIGARLNIYFQLGQGEKIQEELRHLKATTTLNAEWVSILNWWGVYMEKLHYESGPIKKPN
jgi:hypothetical protein